MVAYAFNIEASLVYIVSSRPTNRGYTRRHCLKGKNKERQGGRKKETKKKEIKKGKKMKKSKCEAHFFYSVGYMKYRFPCYFNS